MEAIVYLVVILVVVLYFNKVIKKFTAVVSENLDISLDMSTDEMSQVRADQILRHANNDAKRTARVAELPTEGRLTASDIIKLRKENKL
jgi:hypothetical protein